MKLNILSYIDLNIWAESNSGAYQEHFHDIWEWIEKIIDIVKRNWIEVFITVMANLFFFL